MGKHNVNVHAQHVFQSSDHQVLRWFNGLMFGNNKRPYNHYTIFSRVNCTGLAALFLQLK